MSSVRRQATPIEAQRIATVGVPMDLGQSRRGVDMGPFAVRYAGLNRLLRRLGHQVEDLGNLQIAERDTLVSGSGLDYLPQVVETCALVYETAARLTAAGQVPLFLGGDHSIALGTVSGVSHHQPCGLLWVDAHGDFNTPETSPSGNIHGMPLAALLGRGAPEMVNLGRRGAKLEPEHVVLIGIRDLDDGERVALRKSGVTVFTMHDIDEHGMAEIAGLALAQLAELPRIHVSLDMDSIDPVAAPGVGTPVPGGITHREAHLLMEIIAENGRVGSVDVVEVNPILDHENRTARMACELVASLFGKRIF